jgi:hypothetical protein
MGFSCLSNLSNDDRVDFQSISETETMATAMMIIQYCGKQENSSDESVMKLIIRIKWATRNKGSRGSGRHL